MSAITAIGDRTEAMLAALQEARERTLTLVCAIGDDDLERVHSSLMSPLAWDLGHIAAFEDLWLGHRAGGMELLRPQLAEVYDAFETPRAGRGELPYLGPDEARAYQEQVRARTREIVARGRAGDLAIAELVLRHEHQHDETMLQTIQLARLPGPPADLMAGGDRSAGPAQTDGGAPAATGLELVEVGGGPCRIGAGPDGFAYDNERPARTVELPAFRIGRTPVTNGAFAEFIAAGGYRRREWWTDAGWALVRSEGLARPGGWSEDLAHEWRLGEHVALHPDRPVVHVSCHEAEAFARAHGLRLPTEAEWEQAARWDPVRARPQAQPWGEAATVPGVHANLDHGAGGPAPVGSLPGGVSPYGCEQMIGDVWEWTASTFGPYPGFRAHPYREYSEVFFGEDYRVLRGGSWATRPSIATPSFRNWDLPQRRQIFAGLRVAADR